MMLTVGSIDSPMIEAALQDDDAVQYAAPGYLLFVRDRTLVAQKFDATSLTLEGEPVPMGEGLGTDDVGLASFSASRNGVLVFGAENWAARACVWVDRSGKETPVIDAPADYRDTALSPDGTRLVYDLADGHEGRSVDSRPGARRVVAFHLRGAASELNPQWSPDGRRIVYTSKAKGPGDLYVKDASGTREAEPLLVDADEKYVSDWSRRRQLHPVHHRAAARAAAGTSSRCRWTATAKPFPLVKTQFCEMWATFSPDGKYIAYQSNESGRHEIYVHEFPGGAEQMAGVHRRRQRAVLARRWPRAVLSLRSTD